VEYANPVFARLEANNQYHAGAATTLSKWVPTWPEPVAPAPGVPLRFGTYNTMLFPTDARATAIATNIKSHGLDVVALQENDVASVTVIVGILGKPWAAAPSDAPQQQIIYRADKFSVVSSGKFDVPNPRVPATPLATPWARFAPVNATPGKTQNFIVVCVHFSEDSSKTKLNINRDTGLAAQAAIRGIDAANTNGEPVIVAGDLRYGREPFGDPVGYTAAHPTFIRAGYYDSMATAKKTNTDYASVNSVAGDGVPTARQTPHLSGAPGRCDHILTKGFQGSFAFVNVINWAYLGSVPSDHNLQYADLAIPFL